MPHRHNFCEICLVGSGQALWHSGESQKRVGAGDVLLARPGAIHQISQTRELELFWVTFALQKAVSDAALVPDAAINRLWSAFEMAERALARDDGALLSLWLALKAVAGGGEIAGKNAQIEAIQSALLLAIVQLGAGNLVPAGIAPQPESHAIARLAARYLQDNLGRKIGLSEVAAQVHLSPRQLGRVFGAFAGVSPALYLETARLDRAKHLLRTSNRPIKEIAATVGFGDVHYFTRWFSARIGAPPAKFRRESEARGAIIHKDGALV